MDNHDERCQCNCDYCNMTDEPCRRCVVATQASGMQLYGISKDGARPYLYADHDPALPYGDDYLSRLLAINEAQQPGASFAIVGPFPDQEVS